MDGLIRLQCYLRGRAGKGLNSQRQGTKGEDGTADHGLELGLEQVGEIDVKLILFEALCNNTAFVSLLP